MAVSPFVISMLIPLITVAISATIFGPAAYNTNKIRPKVTKRGMYRDVLRLNKKREKLLEKQKDPNISKRKMKKISKKLQNITRQIDKKADKLESKNYRAGEMRELKDKLFYGDGYHAKKQTKKQAKKQNLKQAQTQDQRSQNISKKEDAKSGKKLYSPFQSKDGKGISVFDNKKRKNLFEVRTDSKNYQNKVKELYTDLDQSKVTTSDDSYFISVTFYEKKEEKTEIIEASDKKIFKNLKDEYFADLAKRVDFNNMSRPLKVTFEHNLAEKTKNIKNANHLKQLNSKINDHINENKQQKKSQMSQEKGKSELKP